MKFFTRSLFLFAHLFCVGSRQGDAEKLVVASLARGTGARFVGSLSPVVFEGTALRGVAIAFKSDKQADALLGYFQHLAKKKKVTTKRAPSNDKVRNFFEFWNDFGY